MNTNSKFSVAQLLVIRLKIRDEYDIRVSKLKNIRERHILRLIDTPLPSAEPTYSIVLRKLIRDIDEAIKNHESMRDAVLKAFDYNYPEAP